MTSKQRGQPQRQKKSRIPELKSREEAAKWFDGHDLGDYIVNRSI